MPRYRYILGTSVFSFIKSCLLSNFPVRVIVAHKINLALEIEMVGVTSVAGFRATGDPQAFRIVVTLKLAALGKNVQRAACSRGTDCRSARSDISLQFVYVAQTA